MADLHPIALQLIPELQPFLPADMARVVGEYVEDGEPVLGLEVALLNLADTTVPAVLLEPLAADPGPLAAALAGVPQTRRE